MRTRKVMVLVGFVALILFLGAGQVVAQEFGPDIPSETMAGAPTVVAYQGQVTLGGSAYTGTGYFKFALVDQAGTTSYWSNDGTSSGGGAPASAVSLTVTSGLFNLLLGDTTLAHMAALPATAFSNPDRYLRVWFSSGGTTFTQLSPDRRITAVPYALQAQEAKNADTLDGSHASGFASLDASGSLRIVGDSAPVARGTTTTNLSSPSSIYISGHYAYVVSINNNSLAIFDISNPGNPVAKGTNTTNLSSPFAVYVSGSYAYVASSGNNRLAVFDVSDPGNIVAKGYTSTNLYGPVSVYISGRFAYVASWNNSRLAVFDVSDPGNIVAKGYTSMNLDEPRSVFVSGRYAYVTSVNNNTLAVFDVSDPANIVAKGYTSMNLNYPYSVYVSGRYAYVTSQSNNRLAIFDISDSSNIVAKGYTSTNLGNPGSVYISGRYAYVASESNNRLAIFDISDPNSILAKGYTSINLNRPTSVYVSGRYAYVASWNNNTLAIFDLGHLETPTLETGSLQSGYLDVSDNAIVGNNLYVQGGLNVGPGGELVGGDLGVQGDLQVVGSILTRVTTVTANTTLAVTQSGVVLADSASAVTITLPSASGAKGVTFTIKRIGTGAVTVNSAGGTIDGAASQSLAAQYSLITVVSDGTNWYVAAH